MVKVVIYTVSMVEGVSYLHGTVERSEGTARGELITSLQQRNREGNAGYTYSILTKDEHECSLDSYFMRSCVHVRYVVLFDML